MAAKKPKWERKAEDRPGELLQAALRVFSRKGYRATRLESVAEEAGVSKGTIYRYFENKEDLLKRALEERVRILIVQAEEALEGFEGRPREKLRFILERFWKRSEDPDWGRFHRLMFGEIANELPSLFRLWIQKGTLQGWRLVEGVIRQGQAAGAFRKDADAKGIAQFAVSGLSHQAYLMAHIGGGKWDTCPADRVFASAFDLLIAGLEKRKPSGTGKEKGP